MILTLYEPFRHWSETGSVYILSDPHFGDSDCKLMDPGWIEPEEQVARINALVMKNDTFVCLGDVGDASFVKQIRARKKILLLGNHDKKKDYKGLFDEIYDGPLLIAEKILLSHEPVYGLPWCLNIHGHDHSNIESYKEGCKHLNLAANVCDYTPVSLGKLIKGGILSDITSIHRITIDRATEKKEKCMEKQFPTIDKVKTGKQIRRLMNSLGLTVTDVQKYMGLATQQAVYHWLNGRSLPSIDNVYALSELFKVPMDQIICGNREYQPEQGSMYYRLKAYAKYLRMCVTVACEGKGREQNCFIIESI